MTEILAVVAAKTDGPGETHRFNLAISPVRPGKGELGCRSVPPDEDGCEGSLARYLKEIGPALRNRLFPTSAGFER